MVSYCGVSVAIVCWFIVFVTPMEASVDSELSFTPCGDVGGMCRCQGTTADCSRNNGKLTFIPAFSPSVTTLIFTHNDLNCIQSHSFFKNVTDLLELDISINWLSEVKAGAFQVFNRLKILHSRGNNLSYSQLEQVFAIPTLQVLNLCHATLKPLPDDLFYKNPMPTLTALDLSFNVQLEWINMTALKPLRNLTNLGLNSAGIERVHSDHLPSLQTLDMRSNMLITFPRTCDAKGQTYYPGLVDLDVSENDIHSLSCFRTVQCLCLPELQVLRLEENPIMKMNMTLFKELRNLKELSFRRLATKHIYPDHLPSLEKLDFRYNGLTAFPITCSIDGQPFYPRLSYLDIGLNKLKFSSSPVPERGICLPSLTKLVVASDGPDKLNMTFLKPLSNLRILSADNGQFTSVVSDFMPSLETLQLKYNELTVVPETCSPDGQSLFPRLSTLDLSHNSVEYFKWMAFAMDTFCLPELKILHLEYNILHFGKPVMYFTFSNPSVIHIDLSHNKLDFASESEDLFSKCTNLSVLNVAGNILRSISPTKLQRLLSPLVSLRVLDLSDTNLDRITKETFKSVENISELHLQQNKISVIPDGAFDGLEHLTILRLDGNALFSISESTFSLGTQRRLKTLNLSHNPFECTCSLLWFYQWMTHEPALFYYHNPYTRYDCNMPGVHLATFFHTEQKCLLSHSASSIVIAFFTLFIIVLTLSTVFFRYRWRIRLALYEAFRGDPLARWRQRPLEDFLYDLFVCYDSEDSRWVLNHLMPVLEEQMELRLCVHQRDFIPGKNITDNIVDSLAVSKRVLALFSPNFAESQWCNFELELCLTHVVEGDDVMVLVLLEEVPARDMSGAMRALMKTTTYIEWNNDPEAVASFWRRMTLALGDILPGVNR